MKNTNSRALKHRKPNTLTVKHFAQLLKDEAPKDSVNHPTHYGGDTPYETIKVLKAWLTPEEYRGFLIGNAIKYLSRAGKKGDALEDQKKAAWYLAELNK